LLFHSLPCARLSPFSMSGNTTSLIKYYHKVDVPRNIVREFDVIIDVGDDIDSYVKGNQGLPRAPRTEVERDTNSAQTTE